MRLMVSKLAFLSVLFLCLFTFACGQSKSNEEISLDYERQADELTTKGNVKGAIEQQIKAIEANPKKVRLYTILAGLYYDSNEYQKAVEIAQKAVKLDSSYPNSHYTLGVMLRQVGEKERAIRSFQEAVKLSPQNTNFLINLGITYEDINNKQLARKYYERALEVDSNYVPAIYLLGTLEAEAGRIDKAIELFEKAVNMEIPEDRKAEEIGSQRDAQERLEELKNQKAKTASPK